LAEIEALSIADSTNLVIRGIPYCGEVVEKSLSTRALYLIMSS